MAIIVVALNSPATRVSAFPMVSALLQADTSCVRKVVPFGGGWKLHVSWRNVITHDGIAEQKIGELVAKLEPIGVISLLSQAEHQSRQVADQKLKEAKEEQMTHLIPAKRAADLATELLQLRGRLFAAEISDLVGTAQKMSAAGLRFQASSGLEASSTVQAEDDQGDKFEARWRGRTSSHVAASFATPPSAFDLR
ncbi:unnamed protein product, partial [Cladocopium goreaui]